MTTVKQEQQPDWRSLPMVGQMQYLFQTGELSDCSFLVSKYGGEAERIAAHKFPLCRMSEVFNTMFTGTMPEKGEVRVEDIYPQHFKAMLLYMYTEKLDLSDLDMSLQVMMAAHKYHIVPLVNKCAELATEKMQSGDVCRVLHMANLLENKQLEHAALKMLQERTEEVLNASSWVDTPSSVVLTVVQQDSLNVSSELSLLTACQYWSRSRHHVSADQTARDILDQFLPYLRLRTLTTGQFTKFTLGDDCMFTTEECMQILQSIVTPGPSMMLSGFSDLTVRRIAPVISDKEEDLMTVVMRSVEKQKISILKLGRVSAFSKVPPFILSSNYHILLYGVQYCPMSTSDADILDRLVINNQYQESLYIQFIDLETRACVAALKYKGTLSYGSPCMDILFQQPYLLKKNTKLVVKVTYTEVKGKRSCFIMASNAVGHFIYPGVVGSVVGLIGISQVMYKIIN